MRPLSFTIEIPERPIYVPNSGPPMAPISLIPENEETGWVIADTVDFGGISQYLITPKDNPVHRRVVRKEYILLWVSAKAHEDYEYGLYKLHEQEEEQREARVLARAAELKVRRWAQEQARREARVKARASMLGQPRAESISMTTSAVYSSASESEGSYKDLSATQTLLAKRKHSLTYSNVTEDSVKRQAIAAMGPAQLQQRISQLFAGLPQRTLQPTLIVNDDGNGRDDSHSEHENIYVKMDPKPEEPRPDYRPILPPPKLMSGSSSSSSKRVGAASSSRTSITTLPGPACNASGPRRHLSVKTPGRSSLPIAQPLVSSSNDNERSQVGLGEAYLPILPRPRSLNARSSSTEIASNQNLIKSNKKSRDSPESPSSNRSQIISTSNFKPTPAHILAEGQSARKTPKSILSITSNAIRSSNKMSHRIESTLIGNGDLEDPDIGSNLNESRYVRATTQSHQNIPKRTRAESQALEEQNSLSDSDSDSESETNESNGDTWQINGLLKDEMRLENGDLVQYYLVDWDGGWDPTWEPETNISSPAIKAYLKEQRDLYGNFDETAGGVGPSESRNRLANASRTHTDEDREEEVTSDSSEAFVMSTSAPIFVSPARVSEPQAGGAIMGEGVVEPD